MYKGHLTVLVNFGDEKYRKAQLFNSKTGRRIAGFDKVREYTLNDIDEDFYRRNNSILSEHRGSGLWLWKPYFIYKTLNEMNDGDYLFYCDSGACFIRRITELIENMGDDDIWVSDIPLIEKEWTQIAVFERFDAKWIDKIRETNQIQAGFFLCRKSIKAEQFIKKWLDLCCEIELIKFNEKDVQDKCFIQHREDQSILSVLCKVEGIKPHKDPTQYGRIPEKYKRDNAEFRIPIHTKDEYSPIVILHRTAEANRKTIIRQMIVSFLPKKVVHCIRRLKG